MLTHNFLKRSLPIITQSARAHRKPRWLPVAKSKIYRIPQRPEVTEEERVELLRINNNYKTQMRAIRRFYFEEIVKENASLQSTSSEMSQMVDAEDWERCIEINEQWNAQVAAERDERRKLELEAMEERALARMEARDEELKNRIERASEKIKLQKELSATFITPETLEVAIDHALANPVDYNFAINLEGQQFHGRDTPIPSPTKDKQAASAQSAQASAQSAQASAPSAQA